MATKQNKKQKAFVTIRLPEEMRRVNQRAHVFADRKKKASKDACRGRRWE